MWCDGRAGSNHGKYRTHAHICIYTIIQKTHLNHVRHALRMRAGGRVVVPGAVGACVGVGE